MSEKIYGFLAKKNLSQNEIELYGLNSIILECIEREKEIEKIREERERFIEELGLKEALARLEAKIKI